MRLIDADSAYDYLYEHLDDNAMIAAQNALDEMPTIEPEVRHGRWTKDGCEHRYFYYRCSVCGVDKDGRTKFCPNCGAKMDGGAEQ